MKEWSLCVSKLRQQQQEFFKLLRGQHAGSSFLQEDVVSTKNLDAQQRLSIYRNSISENLIQTLKSTYPVCLKLVGDEFFHGLGERFVDQTPSTSYSLDDYDHKLP